MYRWVVVRMVFYIICNAAFSDWDDERNVNVNRNQDDWNGNWWAAGVRN